MFALVLGAFEDAEEDESRTDTGVQHTEEDQRGNHQAEADLQVDSVAQGAECWSSVVLRTSVPVNDATNERENDNLSDSDNRHGLAEIVWVLHLGDERGKSNLANEGIRNVEKRVHATIERSLGKWDDLDDGFANLGK